MKKLKIAFFGTPDIAVPSLKNISQMTIVEKVYVISMPDRPAGRGNKLKSPEVIEFAKNENLEFFQTQNINKEFAFLEKLKNEKIDLFIVFAFAQFLSEKVLSLPNLGCFNIHTSLLPKYRGAAPIQYALLNGDKETGVSIQKMVKKMDAGDIGLSKKVDIEKDDNGAKLYNKLKIISANAIVEFIEKLVQNKIQFEAQDETLVSFAPTIKKHEGELKFIDSTYNTISNKIRAFDPWPGTYCHLQIGERSKRLKIYEIERDLAQLPPGKLSIELGTLLVGCKDATIRLKNVQLEGKKACSDVQLLNGIRDTISLG